MRLPKQPLIFGEWRLQLLYNAVLWLAALIHKIYIHTNLVVNAAFIIAALQKIQL
jgi:hypothetical protein